MLEQQVFQVLREWCKWLSEIDRGVEDGLDGLIAVHDEERQRGVRKWRVQQATGNELEEGERVAGLEH